MLLAIEITAGWLLAALATAGAASALFTGAERLAARGDGELPEQ